MDLCARDGEDVVAPAMGGERGHDIDEFAVKHGVDLMLVPNDYGTIVYDTLRLMLAVFSGVCAARVDNVGTIEQFVRGWCLSSGTYDAYAQAGGAMEDVVTVCAGVYYRQESIPDFGRASQRLYDQLATGAARGLQHVVTARRV